MSKIEQLESECIVCGANTPMIKILGFCHCVVAKEGGGYNCLEYEGLYEIELLELFWHKEGSKKRPVSEHRTRRKYQPFYKTRKWLDTRFAVLHKYGHQCMSCGLRAGQKTQYGDNVILQIDHIKPISKRWDLRLNMDNLQVLCRECNLGKGNRYNDDLKKGQRIQQE